MVMPRHGRCRLTGAGCLVDLLCQVTAEGWGPQHVIVRDDATGQLVGACPMYLKGHSYGEYVFDHSWANYSSMLGKRCDIQLVIVCSALAQVPGTGPARCPVDDLSVQLSDVQSNSAKSNINFTLY